MVGGGEGADDTRVVESGVLRDRIRSSLLKTTIDEDLRLGPGFKAL